jgi:hypothetical protein
VLRRDEAGIEVLATRGDRELGAWDWDNALLRLVDDRRRAQGESLSEPDLAAAADRVRPLLQP